MLYNIEIDISLNFLTIKMKISICFITEHLMMFVSIYYAYLHLVSDKPHTINVLSLSYLLFHFF